MSIWEIFGGEKKKESPTGADREKQFEIQHLRDDLETQRFWLEEHERKGDGRSAEETRKRIKEIEEELRELGVEIEEEEKIAA